MAGEDPLRLSDLLRWGRVTPDGWLRAGGRWLIPADHVEQVLRRIRECRVWPRGSRPRRKPGPLPPALAT